MDLNKVMIIGRLTADPESKTTPTGVSVCSFSVATNKQWTDQAGAKQKKVTFHNIVAWRKLAEICSQYLKKGAQVYIEGALETRSWDDQAGVKRYKTEIIAEDMIMLGGKGDNTSAPTGVTAAKPKEKAAVAADLPTIQTKDDEIQLENIPF